MNASETGQGDEGGKADPILDCVTALPPALASRIAANAEALHLLAPYCQPQAPAAVAAVAQAHRRVSLMGRAQQQAAQAAPYAVRLDLQPGEQPGCLVPSLEWLLAHPGLASVSLNVSTQQGSTQQGCTLSLQEAQLLGRLLAAHNPETSSRPVTTVTIQAARPELWRSLADLNQRFDAGMLSPFRHLQRVELLWFAGADLAGLPHSVQDVKLTLPGSDFAAQLHRHMLSLAQQALQQLGQAGAAEAAAAAEGPEALVGGAVPAADAEPVPVVAGDGAMVFAQVGQALPVFAGAAEQPEEPQPEQPQPQPQQPQPQPQPQQPQPQQQPLPPMPPPPQPQQAWQHRIGDALYSYMCHWAPSYALETAVRAWLGYPSSLALSLACAATIRVAAFLYRRWIRRWAVAAAIAAAAMLEQPAPQGAAAAGQQDPLVIALQAALNAMVAVHVAREQGDAALHPIDQWPPFLLRKLEIVGHDLSVELPTGALFASAREVSVLAEPLCLLLPAEVAAQQVQQAPAARRLPAWRFWRVAPALGGTEAEAARRLHALLHAFKLQAGSGCVTVLAAPHWQLRLDSAAAAGSALSAAQQPAVVALTEEQVGQLLRDEVSCPPGVCVSPGQHLLPNGSTINWLTLSSQPNVFLLSDMEVIEAVLLAALALITTAIACIAAFLSSIREPAAGRWSAGWSGSF